MIELLKLNALRYCGNFSSRCNAGYALHSCTLSGCMSVCPFVSLSCLSVCLVVCLSVHLSACLSLCLVCLSVWLCVCLSNCLPVCLSVLSLYLVVSQEYKCVESSHLADIFCESRETGDAVSRLKDQG